MSTIFSMEDLIEEFARREFSNRSDRLRDLTPKTQVYNITAQHTRTHAHIYIDTHTHTHTHTALYVVSMDSYIIMANNKVIICLVRHTSVLSTSE